MLLLKCLVLSSSLLPCLVVRVKTSSFVSTIPILLIAVHMCIFPHCSNKGLASVMLYNSLFTRVLLFPFTFCLFILLLICSDADKPVWL